jgi:hypothetical protein
MPWLVIFMKDTGKLASTKPKVEASVADAPVEPVYRSDINLRNQVGYMTKADGSIARDREGNPIAFSSTILL